MFGLEATDLLTRRGRVKKMLEDGYSIVEIATTLGEPESTVRAWAKMIADNKDE